MIEEINPETIENISNHPIYGIVEDYGQINIRGIWYKYNQKTDRLVCFTKLMTEELFKCPAQEEMRLI
jgi:hypothetical protein